MLKFETIEDFTVASKVSDTLVKVRLRRQLDYTPSRYSSGPYFLDLKVGSICQMQYGIDEQQAREAATRFLLLHVDGLAPTQH